MYVYVEYCKFDDKLISGAHADSGAHKKCAMKIKKER